MRVVALLMLVALVSGCAAFPGTPGAPTSTSRSSAPPAAGPDEAPAGSTEDPSIPEAGDAISPDRPIGPVPDVTPPGMTQAPAGAGVEAYTGQELDWRRCTYGEKEFHCATTLVPMDWEHPGEAALSLFLLKAPATASPRLGTIFVNPGGPGEPGSTTAATFRREGLEQYDIVGWDPRGTGRSTPVDCGPPEPVEEFLSADASPDDPAERAAYIEVNRALGQACLEHSGRLLENVSTIDTVRDLDLLRQLVGDERLNYFGYSYGTTIGSRYAHLFPDRVGRMALDGATNVSDDRSVIQATGFERALEGFADWCAAEKCELGRDRAAVITSVTGLFDDLDRKPLPVGDRELSQSRAVTGMVMMLYGSEREWRHLLDAVKRARSGDGALLLQLADLYDGRDRDGSYDTRTVAFLAIRCLDREDAGLAGADEALAADIEKAPILVPYFGPDYSCAVWPVAPEPKPEPVTAPGAPPILVIGTTRDSATPYEYAVRMAEQLESGVLLTYEGSGHTAYGGQSECVNNAVTRFFTTAAAAGNLTCR